MNVKPVVIVRTDAAGMNKTERAYAAQAAKEKP